MSFKKKWKNQTYGENGKQIGIYKSWIDMHRRAGNKDGKHPSYADVSVCEKWLNYDNFFEDMHDSWFEGSTLDKDIKIPGNRCYCPEACQWVTRSENSKEEGTRLRTRFSKKVMCLETNVVYSSFIEAAKAIGSKDPRSMTGAISNCCSGKRKSAGKAIINGKKTKLHWKYAQE